MNSVIQQDLIDFEKKLAIDSAELYNKTIFITGGTGFIGKWLLNTILYLNKARSLNVKIYVLTRNAKNFKESNADIVSDSALNFIEGDIRTFEAKHINPEYIIHAATDASAYLNVHKPLEMADVILEGTKRILDYASVKKTSKLLFLSSGAVYGKQPDEIAGFSENFSGAPNQLERGASYAEAKRMAEFYCATYARTTEINITIARCFAFVGPYLSLNTHFAIGNFIGNGLKNEDIIVKSNGSPLRSYMYASDLTIWLWTILLKGKSGEAYNVGSDEATSIKDLAFTVASFFPNLKVQILNLTNITDRNQNYIPNIQKTLHEFKFSPCISLNDAILKTIEFNKNKL